MLVIGITAGLEISSASDLYNDTDLNIEDNEDTLNQTDYGIYNDTDVPELADGNDNDEPELMDGIALEAPNWDDYEKPKQDSSYFSNNNSNKELDFDSSTPDDSSYIQDLKINGRTFYEPMDVVNKYPILQMLSNEEQEYYDSSTLNDMLDALWESANILYEDKSIAQRHQLMSGEMQLSNEEEHIKDIFEKIAKNMQDIIEKQRSQYLDDGLEKIDRNLNMFIMQLGYNMLQN